MKATVKKWNLDRDVHLEHKLTQAVWQEEYGRWELTIETPYRIIVEHADFLVSGQGVQK